jgi:nucleotide-binding universal stress UspA family protein
VSEGLIREAAERAHARGDAEVFLVYVDEVPGLFYPPHIRASDEALRVLAGNSAALEKLGVTPSRVWTLSHSAAGSVAEAAVSLGCDTVFIGATRRTLLWQAIRGRFIQDLLRHLPSSIRLIVVH